MTSETIPPEDVRRAAVEAADSVIRAADGCTCLACQMQGAEIIARAIIAERERCALAAEKVKSNAEAFVRDRLSGHSIDFQRFGEGAAAAASAIRAPRP